jgi:flagellar biogenesis protein FliO
VPLVRLQNRDSGQKLEWVRMAGDMIFIFAGAVPTALGVLRSVRVPPRKDLLQNLIMRRVRFLGKRRRVTVNQ